MASSERIMNMEGAMNLKDVAAELVAGCREGRETENLGKLYAGDAVSVEARDMGNGRETHGLDGIRGKHDWWDGAMEVHAQKVEGPFLFGAPDDASGRFAATFEVEATEKANGKRHHTKEVAVYHVEDGKIVREEFYYDG